MCINCSCHDQIIQVWKIVLQIISLFGSVYADFDVFADITLAPKTLT